MLQTETSHKISRSLTHIEPSAERRALLEITMSSRTDCFTQLSDDDDVSIASAAHFTGGYYPPPSEPFEPATESPDDASELQTSVHANGDGSGQEIGESEGPIVPPAAEMEPKEGSALREWRRENAIRLEEKERRERELLTQITDEAEQFKAEFHRKREIAVENNKVYIREKEKLFVANLEKFHAEADKDYWKSIAELIPKEAVTALDKKKGKKDENRKPSITVIKGPKPGRSTDLSRLRHLITKLKNDAPSHLKLSSPAVTIAVKDTNDTPVTTDTEVVLAAA